MTEKRLIRILVAAIAFVLANIIGLLAFAIGEGRTRTAYVVCTAGGEVNIRNRASLGGEITGRVFFGQTVTVDRTAGRWAHCIDLSNESAEGWICMGYLCSEPPRQDRGTEYIVRANGRVAAWSGMDRKERWCWVKPGTVVQVWAWADDMALTNKGYIRREYMWAE